MAGKKRYAPEFLKFALSSGYQLIRETQDKRRVLVRHKKSGRLIVLPLYTYDGGRDIAEFTAMIRRGAKRRRR